MYVLFRVVHFLHGLLLENNTAVAWRPSASSGNGSRVCCLRLPQALVRECFFPSSPLPPLPLRIIDICIVFRLTFMLATNSLLCRVVPSGEFLNGMICT